MSDRFDSSPSCKSHIMQTPFNAPPPFDMDQFGGFTGFLEADSLPFDLNGALDSGPTVNTLPFATNYYPVNATVAPTSDTSTSIMTQPSEVGFAGNSWESAPTVNPALLEVGSAGNALTDMTPFPLHQPFNTLGMAADMTQMSYMPTPLSWDGTTTNQSVTVPSQLHYQPLGAGSSAGAEDRHPNTCNFIGCRKSFKRLTDLNRHIKSIHMKEEHWCHVAGCARAEGGRAFNRKDKRDEHIRKVHKG